MPDPDPLLSQITATAHETCLYNRVRRNMIFAWLSQDLGQDISLKFKARRGQAVLKGTAGKRKVRAHELAIIDAERRSLTWCWAEGAQLGPDEATYAHALQAAGVQRGLSVFSTENVHIPAGFDLKRVSTEVAFAASSLLGREYVIFEVELDRQGSWAVFVLDFEDTLVPTPTSVDISNSLADVLDASFDPLASLEGLVESEPGWHLAELNATQHILRDPNGNEHIVEGLKHCAMA
ncbi:hypothetical protein QVA66_11090 [Staphylococcus chromogenes]|nr:hypothetical protein [Staphylococcus chromogenes]